MQLDLEPLHRTWGFMTKSQCNIFLAKRQSVEAPAAALRAALESRDVGVFWQGVMDRKAPTASRHQERSRELIERSRMFVLFVSIDEWWETDGQTCWQKVEADFAQKIFEETSAPPGFFQLYTVWARPHGYREVDFEVNMRSEGLAFWAGQNAGQVRLDERGQIDPESVEAVADDIVRLIGEGDRLLNRTPATTPAKQPSAQKFDYVAFWNSQARRMLNPGDRDGQPDQKGPFGYSPDRFIAINCQEVGGGEESQSIEVPLAEEMFRKRENLLVLQGDAGTGKTRTVTTIAMTLTPELEGIAPVLSESQVAHVRSAALKNVKTEDWRPVVLSCTDLADLDPDKITAPQPRDRFFQRAALIHPELTGWVDDIGSSRYLIVLDGLDEVHDAELEDKLLLEFLEVWRYSRRNDRLRMIVSTRPDWLGGQGDIDIIKPLHPNREQIRAFAKAFVDNLRIGDSDERKAVQTRVNKWLKKLDPELSTSIGAASNDWVEILRRPLLLNALLWSISEDRGTAEADVDRFFGSIIDHLLSVKPGERRPPKFSQIMRRVLQEICLKIVPARFLNKDEAIGVVREVIEKYRDDLPDESADEILQFLARKTNLLHYDKGKKAWSVAPGFLGSFLMAERFALPEDEGGARIEPLIAQLQWRDRDKWKDTLRFTFALRQHAETRGKAGSLCDPEWVFRVPAGLMGRGESGRDDQDKLKWLEVACNAFRYGVSREAVRDEGRELALDIARRGVDIYLDLAKRLSPRERAEAIHSLSILARRWDAIEETPGVAQEILWRILGVKDRWFDTGLQSDCGGQLFLQRHPVLVVNYKAFLAGQYMEDEFWDHCREEQGSKRWTIENQFKRASKAAKRARAPSEVWVQMRERLFLPVTYITWFEAVAYARWFADRLQMSKEIGPQDVVRLMTDNEWANVTRKLAGGASYIWGSDTPGRDGDAPMNYALANFHSATPPGTFPAYGASGLFDLGTNVSSWALPAEDAAWPPAPRRSDTDAQVVGVGGNWNSELYELRLTREPVDPEPSARSITRGLRLVLIRRSQKRD